MWILRFKESSHFRICGNSNSQTVLHMSMRLIFSTCLSRKEHFVKNSYLLKRLQKLRQRPQQQLPLRNLLQVRMHQKLKNQHLNSLNSKQKQRQRKKSELENLKRNGMLLMRKLNFSEHMKISTKNLRSNSKLSKIQQTNMEIQSKSKYLFLFIQLLKSMISSH